MTAALTVIPGVDLTADTSITRTDLDNAIKNMQVGGLTDSHAHATASTVPAIGTSSPGGTKVGQLWMDTNTPGTLRRGNGTDFPPVTAWLTSATAPTYTALAGMGWYDTTNNLQRVYATIDGITGWHPLNQQFQLWKSIEGATTIASGDVVIFNTASGTDYRRASLPLLEKDGHVLGVALESITPTGSGATNVGLIALVGCERVVTINVNNAGGTMSAGHCLVSFGAASGKARSVGPSQATNFANPNATVTFQNLDIPFGGFAVAVETPAVSATTTAKARLLPQVGQGAWQSCPLTSLATSADDLVDANWDGAFHLLDLTTGSVPSGATAYVVPAHAPMLAVVVSLYGQATKSATGIAKLTFQLSSNNASGGVGAEAFGLHHASAVSEDLAVAETEMRCITTAGTPYTDKGSRLYWAGTKTVVSGGGTIAINAATLKLVRYLY